MSTYDALMKAAKQVHEDRLVAEFGPGGGNPDAKLEDSLEYRAAQEIKQLQERKMTSDISTDTEDIARRMTPWVSPVCTYKSSDVPDSELLRVHALRLCEAFRDVRDQWHEKAREADRLRKAAAFVHDDIKKSFGNTKHMLRLRGALSG